MKEWCGKRMGGFVECRWMWRYRLALTFPIRARFSFIFDDVLIRLWLHRLHTLNMKTPVDLLGMVLCGFWWIGLTIIICSAQALEKVLPHDVLTHCKDGCVLLWSVKMYRFRTHSPFTWELIDNQGIKGLKTIAWYQSHCITASDHFTGSTLTSKTLITLISNDLIYCSNVRPKAVS